MFSHLQDSAKCQHAKMGKRCRGRGKVAGFYWDKDGILGDKHEVWHPVNEKHLCNICTTSAQRRRRWAVGPSLYKSYTNVLSLLGSQEVNR